MHTRIALPLLLFASACAQLPDTSQVGTLEAQQAASSSVQTSVKPAAAPLTQPTVGISKPSTQNAAKEAPPVAEAFAAPSTAAPGPSPAVVPPPAAAQA